MLVLRHSLLPTGGKAVPSSILTSRGLPLLQLRSASSDARRGQRRVPQSRIPPLSVPNSISTVEALASVKAALNGAIRSGTFPSCPLFPPLLKLNPDLQRRALNSILDSPDNNDLLEFVGDSMLNLVLALNVRKYGSGSGFPTALMGILKANETFGRLAFALNLHTTAGVQMTVHQRAAVDHWLSTDRSSPPPKVLADLLEAFAGAVYLQNNHSWDALSSWATSLLEPLASHSIARLSLDAGAADPAFESKALSAAQTCVGNHLIRAWICHAFIKQFPQYDGQAGSAGVATKITTLIVEKTVLRELAFVLLRPRRTGKPHRRSLTVKPTQDPLSSSNLTSDNGDAARVFKLAVGMYFDQDPHTAMEWGQAFFAPIVLHAHECLT